MRIHITDYIGGDLERYKAEEYIFSELDRLGFAYSVKVEK